MKPDRVSLAFFTFFLLICATGRAAGPKRYFYSSNSKRPAAVETVLDAKDSEAFLSLLGDEEIHATLEVNKDGKVSYVVLGGKGKESAPRLLAEGKQPFQVIYATDNLTGKPKFVFHCTVPETGLKSAQCRFWSWVDAEDSTLPDFLQKQHTVEETTAGNAKHKWLKTDIKDYGDAKSLFKRMESPLQQGTDAAGSKPIPYEYKTFTAKNGTFQIACARAYENDRATEGYQCLVVTEVAKDLQKIEIDSARDDVATQMYETHKKWLDDVGATKDTLLAQARDIVSQQKAKYDALKKQIDDEKSRRQATFERILATPRGGFGRSPGQVEAAVAGKEVLRAMGADDFFLIAESVTGYRAPKNTITLPNLPTVTVSRPVYGKGK